MVAVGGSASLVAVFGGSHVLDDTYGDFLGSGYNRRLVEYPIFGLRFLKRCLLMVSSSVFGSLDPFSMTELIVMRLEGAEHRHWMMSRSGLHRAIITGELSMPSLFEASHRGCVVSHRGLPQGNWEKNRRRQFIAIIHSALFSSCNFFSNAHPVVLL